MENSRRKMLKAASLGAALAFISGTPALAADEGKMDVLEAINGRRSIRSYKNEPVTEDELKTLLKAAMQSPSAANEQPWEFIVLKDKSLLDQVGAINNYAAFASKAPLAILVCLNEHKEKIKGMGLLDVSMAAQNLLLAAHGIGLGAVFTGIYPEKNRIAGFQKLAKLPDYVIPIGLIVLGKPMMNKEPEDRYNPKAVHENKWEEK